MTHLLACQSGSTADSQCLAGAACHKKNSHEPSGRVGQRVGGLMQADAGRQQERGWGLPSKGRDTGMGGVTGRARPARGFSTKAEWASELPSKGTVAAGGLGACLVLACSSHCL